MKQKKKLLKYFFRLNAENQELILYEMIELYRKQVDTSTLVKPPTSNYSVNRKIIYVNFKKD